MYFEENLMAHNRREQAKLAMALVENLGLDGAMSACRANGWDGVLEILRRTGIEEPQAAATQIYRV